MLGTDIIMPWDEAGSDLCCLTTSLSSSDDIRDAEATGLDLRRSQTVWPMATGEVPKYVLYNSSTEKRPHKGKTRCRPGPRPRDTRQWVEVNSVDSLENEELGPWRQVSLERRNDRFLWCEVVHTADKMDSPPATTDQTPELAEFGSPSGAMSPSMSAWADHFPRTSQIREFSDYK